MGSAGELFDLSGRVALVTGGARGLGRSISMAYAQAGADLIIASRNLENCQEVAAEVQKTTGRKALAYGFHLAHWDEIEGLVETAYAQFGRVDVLVNNAGMSPLYPDVASVGEDLFDKVIGVNFKGPFRLTALVGTRMHEGDGGSIINLSSIGSLRPNSNIIPYAGAKAALNAMTVGFAQTWAPKVRVKCIIPGAFLTDETRYWTEEMRQGRGSLYGRIGNPDEVVGAALYFASEASSFTTGAMLRVDGGGSGTVT